MHSPTDAHPHQFYKNLQGGTAAVHDSRIMTNVLVAASSWMIYDMLLTLKDEVEYLHSPKWNVAKILLIILRLDCLATLSLYIYISAVTPSQVTPVTCEHLIQALFICVAAHWYIGQLLLLWRICALYHGNRKVIGLSIGLYMCEVVVLTGLLVGELKAFRLLSVPPGIPLSGCVPTNLVSPDYFGPAFCAFDLFLSTVFFVLTVAKFLRSARSASTINDSRGLHRFRGIKNVMPVLFLFFRDGSIYYFTIQASQIFFFVFISQPSLKDSALAAIGIPVSVATITLANSRLIYSLRRGLTPNMLTTTFEVVPRQGIVFNHELSYMGDPDQSRS